MKRTINYIILMVMVTIILPLLIVKGCGIEPDNSIPENQKGLKIKVYIKAEDKVQEMTMEEYVRGVVVAEMPAEFGLEALKAQAIAARTYAYGRLKKIYTTNDDLHKGADICTDPSHCQAWSSKYKAMNGWGFLSRSSNWSKITKAVKDTKNIIITYNNKVINPVFHSNSGGRTENSEDVWAGAGEPYLRSVISEGEDVSSEYKNVESIGIKVFISKLKSQYKDIKLNSKNVLKDIDILDYSEGGRVNNLKIGNVTLKGTEFRKIFSLKSANFVIEKGDGDTLDITTFGYGHGVGMSQWGANYLAKSGKGYEEILKYYYTGVELGTMDK